MKKMTLSVLVSFIYEPIQLVVVGMRFLLPVYMMASSISTRSLIS